MSLKKIGLTVAAATVLGVSGISMMVAGSTARAESTTATASSNPAPDSQQRHGGRRGVGHMAPQDGAVRGDGTTRPESRPGGRHGMGGVACTDVVVTGDEAAGVSAAVLAKNPGVTVQVVRKDADGSYDVVGTKDGARVVYEVSADKSTVTEKSASGLR